MDIFNGKKSAGFAFSLFICLFVLLSFFCGTILVSVSSEESFLYKIISSTFSPIALISVCLVYRKKRKESFCQMVNFKACKLNDFLFSILIAFSMLFGLGFLNSAVYNLVRYLGLKTTESDIAMENTLQFICYVLTVAVMPAIAEEAFFRGLILSSLKDVSLVKKVVFSSLIFALYHCSIYKFFYQFIFGVFFAIITFRAKSILPSMIAHFLNNFFILLIEFLKLDLTAFTGNIFVNLAFIVVLTVVGLSSSLAINKEKNGEKGRILECYVTASLGIFLCLLTLALGLVI